MKENREYPSNDRRSTKSEDEGRLSEKRTTFGPTTTIPEKNNSARNSASVNEAARETKKSWVGGARTRAKEKTDTELREECTELIEELEQLEWKPDANLQVQNYQAMTDLLNDELPQYLELALNVQKEIDRYEDEKLELADELGKLYQRAVMERQLSKAVDARRRHGLALSPPEEFLPTDLEDLSQMVTSQWKETIALDIKFWMDNWVEEETQISVAEKMLAQDYEGVSKEYYQIRGLHSKCEREMLEARDQFREIIKGYQKQLKTLKSKMLEIIKRERARHYHMQECLEKRESERETRYQVLRDIRNKAITATYAIHNKLANYVALIRKRWVEAEEQLLELANASDGDVTISAATQKLIAELLLYNPRRVNRIRDELTKQMDAARRRLGDLLKEISPLMEKRRNDIHQRFERIRKLNEAKSDDSGFDIKPLELTDIDDNYDREKHFLDFLGGSVDMDAYAESLKEGVQGLTSYEDDDEAALRMLIRGSMQ